MWGGAMGERVYTETGGWHGHSWLNYLDSQTKCVLLYISCVWGICLFIDKLHLWYLTQYFKYYMLILYLNLEKELDSLFSFNIWMVPLLGFPGGLDGKAFAYNVGDPGLIPGSGRSSGEGNGNPLQYSCLENPMDRGTWWATVHGVSKNRTWLSDLTWLCFHSLGMH